MGSLKLKLYKFAVGRDDIGSLRDIEVSFSELLYHLWKWGGRSWVRGLVRRHRFKGCGGRLFVGRNVEILFPQYISLGRNIYFGDYTYINGLSREGVRLADNVRIREHSWIQVTSELNNVGKGLAIGENTYIGPRCIIGAGGGISIGSHVMIGAAVDLLAEDHDFGDPDRRISEQGVVREGIVIEDDVWIGNRAIVLDGVRISRGAVVGAGAVVTKDVPPFTIVAGNPARIIGHRNADRPPSDLMNITQQGPG